MSEKINIMMIDANSVSAFSVAKMADENAIKTKTIRRAAMLPDARIESLVIDYKTSEIAVRVVVANAKKSGLYDERMAAVAKQSTPKKKQVGSKREGRR